MKAAPYCQSLALISLLGVTAPAAIAQPITPANDGTGTIINRSGDRFDITGGSLSNNDANLFHSFQQFSLDAGQTANFVSAPNIQNILGRVTGGDPSIINGLIQVTGGQSNLYLMNPAGVIFGPSARLDIPASFSVTTATGIGLGNNWFNAVGTNDYQNLVGTPNRYRFDLQQPGAIVNSADLELAPGQNLTLTGGTVINTGQLSTPGGNVTIAAVEGGNVVRISQPGHLLNLEISNLGLEGRVLSEQQQITPLSLPGLLTEGNANSHATGMTVNERGQVVLTGPGAVVTEMGGTAIASGTIDVSGKGGGGVYVLGDRVGILNANINADGINGGGSIFVGGDFQGSDRLPASQQTVINNNSFLSANAIENGDGGRVIIWSDGTTRFEGNISATGGTNSGNGGLVEVSGKEQLLVNGFIDVSASNGTTGTILFDPENITIDELETNEADGLSAGKTTEEKTKIETRATTDPFASDEDYNVTISAENIEELEGNVTLQADNDITVNQEINTSGSVELKAGRNINVNADIDTSRGNGNISLFGNDNNANPKNRSSGPANITQRNGTTLNAGSGNITIELGFLGQFGDINLDNLTTTGQVFINANSGNINRVSPNSLITANDATIQTLSTGGIGSAAAPLRLDVNNLEVKSGTGGAFIFSVADLNIGGTNDRFRGITSAGDSDIRIAAQGEITVSESIEGGSDIELRSSESIKIDNDINSRGEGSIILRANDENLGVSDRNGSANILQAENTTMNADRGNIEITLGDLGQKGDINVTNLTTTRGILIDGNGGNIGQVGNNSLINGGALLLINRGGGSIGNPTTPLRVDVDNLEAIIGGGGLFLESINNLSIGGVDERLTGILNNQKRGEIILEASGDINVEETITNGSNTTLKAGGNLNLNAEINATKPRSNISLISGGSINLNADINTADGRNSGNIYLQGNDENIANENTAEEAANISMAEGTILNAGSGDIEIKLGNYGEVGDINLNNLTTRGNVFIDANSGDIRRVSADSLIIARGVALQTSGNIGSSSSPIRLDANNLEANAGDKGAFLESISDISIGGVSDEFTGINLEGDGSEIKLTSQGNININEEIQGVRTGKTEDQPSSNIELNAGGSININSDINANRNIILRANDESLGANSRNGSANIIQAEGTTVNADNGNIEIVGQNGDIILNNLTTNFNLLINANGGDIRQVSENSLFTADKSLFQTSGNGGIGESENPINLRVDILQATAGSGGAFFNSLGNVQIGIGDFYEENIGITTEGGGDIELSATGDITVRENISTATEDGRAGNITLESFTGAIDFPKVNVYTSLDASSELGRGGNISLTAAGDIETNEVNSSTNGDRNAGNISIESRNGAVRITGTYFRLESTVDASSLNGNGGTVKITAGTDISASNITTASGRVTRNEGEVNFSGGRSNGGNVFLESGGSIDTTAGTINSSSLIGDGGNITLNGDGDILIDDAVASSGYYDQNTEVRLGAGWGNGGSIVINGGGNISADVLDTTSTARDGGEINIRGDGNITASRLYSGSYGSGDGGSIILNSGGNIDVFYRDFGDLPSKEGVIWSASAEGNGGDVSLTASEDINLDNVWSFSEGSGNGGNVTIDAGRDVFVRFMIISGSVLGKGGNVSAAAGRDVQISDIISGSRDIQVNDTVEQRSSQINSNGGNEQNIAFSAAPNIIQAFDPTNEPAPTLIAPEPPVPEELPPFSSQNTRGGNITLNAGRYIDTTNGNLDSSSRGNGGNISITGTDVRTGNISSFSLGSGGDVNIDVSGIFNSTVGTIDSSSVNGNGGNININSRSTFTGSIFSDSNRRDGGNITINGTNVIHTIWGRETDGDSSNVAIDRPGRTTSFDATRENPPNKGLLYNFDKLPLLAEVLCNCEDLPTDLLARVPTRREIQNLEAPEPMGWIDSGSTWGNGGNIALQAPNGIRTANIFSYPDGNGNGGDIALTSTDGNINTTAGQIVSGSSNGTGGNIDFNAGGDILTGDLFSRSQDRETNALGKETAGNITLSAGGNIDTTEGQISSASAGDGGNVSIESTGGNIETGEILSFSDGNGTGGNITLDAEGNINTTSDDLNSQSQNLGGDIEITAGGDINTKNVKSSGGSRSGDIDMNSTDGRINTTLGTLNSSSDSGIGGEITLKAEDRINAGIIRAGGELQDGDIGITSNNSEVRVTEWPETNGEVNITSGVESASEDFIPSRHNIIIDDGGENDPFRNQPNADARADSDRLNERRGNVKLQAHNDITINESIETTEASSLEIRAGRNININADIDTSANNGNIILEGNSQGANPIFRGQGPGNINMAPDTTVNAGSGTINIRLGTGDIGEVGNINLANLITTGDVTVNARGGNIFRALDNSLINAGNATFETEGSGAIGSANEPLRLEVNNLEAVAGSGGAFFISPNSSINIGGASSDIDGISTTGGDLEITTEGGDITATEQISTPSGNITLNAAENIDAIEALISTFGNSQGGNITLNATDDISTGNVDAGAINGAGGNITMNAGGGINTTAGELQTNSNTDDGGDISLTANGDILTNRVNTTSFSGDDAGNIWIESTNGSIATGSPTESLPADADITNPEIVNRFENAQANLESKSEDGSGGNIELVAPGDITTGNISSRGGVNGGNVSINSKAGNIDTGIIFTVAGSGSGGNIDLTAAINDNSLDATRTASQIFNDTGNINVNHLATYSNQGSGGDITINATGSFNANQLASFGFLQSGDVILNSSNNSINTDNITTQSEGGPSGNISVNGTDVGTGNARTVGTTEAGQIRIEGTDGSIITGNLESISTEGQAGGIALNATENIETRDQTVAAAEGDANIDVNAGENASIADQTATTGDGNANINLNTGGDASIGNQTADTGNGNANIQVRSGGDITGESQEAITNNGDASIGNEAGGNVNLRDQLARATGGNASIANAAEGNIGISNDQTATATGGNAFIDNQAGGSIDVGGSQTATATGGNAFINNVAGDNINVGGDQTATATGGNASINNQAGNNINVGGDQTATANGGDATINNVAGGNIAVGNQTALSDGGNASINNDAGGNLTTGDQIAIAPDGIATINNNLPANEAVEEIVPNQGSVIPIPNNNPVLSVENGAIGGGSGLNSTPATTNLSPVNPSEENLQPSNSGATPLNLNPTIGTASNTGGSILGTEPQSPNVPTPVEVSPQSSIATNNVPTPVEVNSQPLVNNAAPQTAIAPNSIPGVSNNLDNSSPILTTNSSIRNVVTENTRTTSNPDAIVNNIDGEMNSNASTEKTLQRAFTLNAFNLLSSWELGENSQELIDLEESRIQEYVDYFGEDILDSNFNLKNPREILAEMAKQTGHQSAAIYVSAYDDGLQLVLYTATGDPIMRNDYSIKKDEILKMAEAFQQLMSNPNKIGKEDYFQQAQKFYDLLIRPIQRDLDAANVDTLLFSMGSGLRRLPLAALHDGQRFLVEKYGLSMIPSISLMDSRYRSLKGTRVLGMGVEDFGEEKDPLPAVPLELQIIEDFRLSNTFINQGFTRENLIAQRKNYPYEIIHLATHSNIGQTQSESSYIQLWDGDKLRLEEIRELGWNKPPVELLILSSCRAAVENEDAELGFAGLAVATGVKSAIAGLWAVNDGGALALMSEFYSNLDDTAIKAEALKKAQLAMIRGEVKIENGQLWISGQDSPYPLPPELKGLENIDLSHPYYWSAFTIIGSPW